MFRYSAGKEEGKGCSGGKGAGVPGNGAGAAVASASGNIKAPPCRRRDALPGRSDAAQPRHVKTGKRDAAEKLDAQGDKPSTCCGEGEVIRHVQAGGREIDAARLYAVGQRN